ncbi:hypothetical protein EON65_04805 [archaeon]|nr:MAG: hypothetical protein EON65_04805 [archaeon]
MGDANLLQFAQTFCRDVAGNCLVRIGPYSSLYNNCLGNGTVDINSFMHLITNDFASGHGMFSAEHMLFEALSSEAYTFLDKGYPFDISFDSLFQPLLARLKIVHESGNSNAVKEKAMLAADYVDEDLRTIITNVRLINRRKFKPFDCVGTVFLELAKIFYGFVRMFTGGEHVEVETPIFFCTAEINGVKKNILVFRGTLFSIQGIQDILIDSNLGMAGGWARYIASKVEEQLKHVLGDELPDYCVGHSLVST